MTRVCSNHQVRTTPRGAGKLRAPHGILLPPHSPRHSRIALLLPTPRCVTRLATQSGPRAALSPPARRPATRSPSFITDAKHLRPPLPLRSGGSRFHPRLRSSLAAEQAGSARDNPPHGRCWDDATPVAAAHGRLPQIVHMFPQKGP